jgi:hypothetical protein
MGNTPQRQMKKSNARPYNFHYFKPAFFESPEQRPNVSKLNVKSAHVYLLKDVISKQECQYYIEQSETFGYESLDKEYPSVCSNKFLLTNRNIATTIEFL